MLKRLCIRALTNTQQQLRSQLVELFVLEPALSVGFDIQVRGAQLLGFPPGICAQPAIGVQGADLLQQALNLGVLVEATGLLLQYVVGAHASERKIPHSFLIFSPIGVGVEMPRAVPMGVFEQLYQVEAALLIFGSE